MRRFGVEGPGFLDFGDTMVAGLNMALNMLETLVLKEENHYP